MEEIVILTPTFNRVELLKRLYNSLTEQSMKNFKWLIIDDGSTDNTKKYIKKIKNNKRINIEYIYQDNNGKVAAVNTGFDNASSASIVAIVDSDDYLHSNAVETISKYTRKYSANKKVGGMFFHYLNSETGEIIQPESGKIMSDLIMTKYDYDNHYGKHDGCVCYTKNTIDEYRYPVVAGEKYMGPTILQMMISEKYEILFSPEVIGVAEYQKEGLTDKGRKMRMESPKSMLIYTDLMMNKKNPLFVRLKYALSSWPYLLKLKGSSINFITNSNSVILLLLTFIPGVFLYFKWK